jgi:predicted dinucleotide-binding enzyme
MKIAALGAGHIGSTVGPLWQATGHEVTFARTSLDTGSGSRTR